MDNAKAQVLRDAVANENLSPEQRAQAAKLLAQLESAPLNFEQFCERIAAEAAEARDRENQRFKVCGSCYRKQAKERATCELCGRSTWEAAATEPGNPQRCSYIAAATSYSADQLQWYIAHDSMDTAFAKHCAKVLELRGIPRVRSFWERAGFTLDGQPSTGN